MTPSAETHAAKETHNGLVMKRDREDVAAWFSIELNKLEIKLNFGGDMGSLGLMKIYVYVMRPL